MSISKDLDRRNIGAILLEMGAIDKNALETAIRLQHRRLGEILVEEQLVDPVSMAHALKKQAQQVRSRSHSSIGVLASELDDAIHFIQAFERGLAAQGLDLSPESMGQWNGLRAQVEKMLVFPLGGIVEQMQSYAADVGRRLSKRAFLHIDIEDLEVDSTLRAEITEILLQLIRNALFHGIEVPGDRVALGKDPDGHLTLSGRYEAGDLILCVTDDGQGVDLDMVFEKGRSAGVIQVDRHETTDQELLKCLFIPGFSTAEKISEYAGFGIGLDLVEASAQRLGGSVEVTTEKGGGATFTVRLPLAFCRAPLVILHAGENCLGIKATQIKSVTTSNLEALVENRFSTYFPQGSSCKNHSNNFYLNDSLGECWIAEDVSSPQKTLIRGLSSQVKAEYGVLGSFLIPPDHGGPCQAENQGVFVDLSLLKKNKIASI